MNRIRSPHVTSSFLLALVMLLANVSAALADGPILIGPLHDSGIELIVDWGAFQVLDYWELSLNRTLFFDEQGNPSWMVEHALGTDTFTNSATGKSYTLSNDYATRAVFQPELEAQATGIRLRLIIPGAGAVLLEVGRAVLDKDFNLIWLAGQHDLIEGNLDAVCEAMA